MQSTLVVPVRVDVLSDDQTLRVVDTLLMDPTCWPIPLRAPLHESVEENITHLAHSVLSDAEVQAMGRTVRHFVGRVEVWSPSMQQKVEEQLRPQLWKIANGQAAIERTTKVQDSSLVPISIRLIQNQIVVHEDILWDINGPMTPMDFAQSLAQDLNLSEESAVSILTTMLEQLYGLSMDDSPNILVENKLERDARGAWQLDSKDKMSAESQMAQYRAM
jgi:hypothetical protein